MKSIVRIGIGAILFVAFIAITWAISNNGLQAQPLSQSSVPDFTVQAYELVEPKLSLPVSEMPTGISPQLEREINPIKNPGLFTNDLGMTGTNTAIQDTLASKGVNQGYTPSPLQTFEGIGGDSGAGTPPDTTGDVGPNHYVQMINSSYAIYDKVGNLLVGPLANNTLWAGQGGRCETDNSGDPIVLYDEMADRWLLSQFAVGGSPEAMCLAVSTTPDPTGTYYLYEFTMPDFPDYPKLGVWTDGYYMGTNSGVPNAYYAQVFDRVNILTGNAAGHQYVGNLPNFPMPADADSSMPPPANAPGTFYTHLKDGYANHPAGVDRLALYEFDVDWTTPANSTFDLVTELPIAAFNYTVCGFFAGDCIPQPDTTQHLDSVSPWPMARLQYRNFGSYETMVGNFTVDVDGSDWAGIRWFELQRNGATPWSLHQEGTLAPDADHRWMGSIAMDGSGNIALGYSVSSASTYPSLRYATRLRTDPSNTLQAEATMYAGGGSQNGPYDRWGDYSSMNVDPTDNCTFWYTGEYHDVTDTSFNWNTRIGSFKIPGCTGSLGPDFSLSATPANQAVCAPTDAVYDIALDYASGFSGSVALSAINVPVGTTAVINPSSVVTPTMSSMMTLTIGATAPGSYDISIVGVAVPTPTHTTTVGLDVYDAVPSAITLVTPADVATDIDLLPTLTWTADAQGNSYEMQVATDMAFTNIVYTDSLEATSSTIDTSLSPLTTYYWRVYGNNACGDGAWSAIWSFTTRDIPPILLVDDDDNSPDVRAFYTDALDGLGAQYDIWDTNNSDTEPSAAELSPYSTVIWFTGDEFGGAAGPGTAGETALAAWLDGGSCLFLTSQDYFYDRDQTTFMTDYLGLASATNDDGDYASVTGQGTVFSGYGPYTLDYGPVGSDYSDPLTPDGTAEVALLGNNSNNAAIDKDSGVYRTTFWGFSYEAISTATDREEAMGVVLDWCGNGIDTGTLAGTVTDVDSGLAIEGATVTAGSRTVATDANGDYAMALAIGDYDVTAEASNYVSATVMAVSIITDTTTIVDFALAGSALTYSPSEIEEWMSIGDVVTNTVTVTNTGLLPIDFQVSIGGFDGPALRVVPRTIELNVTDESSTERNVPTASTHLLSASGVAAMQSAANQAPLADVDLILDDGSRDDSIGLTAGGQFIWANRFTPAPTDYPFTLNEVQIMFGSSVGVNVGEVVDLYIYEDTDGDGDPSTGATFLGSETGVTVQAVDDVAWSVYALSSPIAFVTPGDVLIAVVNRTAGTDAGEYPAAIDQTVSNGRSWVGIYAAGNPGDPPAIPADDSWDMIDNLGLAGNWMVRGYGSSGASSTDWAYATPTGGTVPANSTMTFDVVFDAQSAIMVGDYSAELEFSGTYVNVVPTMPLTMHLDCPTCGFMDGAITAVDTGLPVAADIHVTSGSGFDVTLSGENYALAIPAGNYDITVSASGYLSETASVTVTQGLTTTTNFALAVPMSMLEYSPSAIEEWMMLGDVVTNTITVTNTGNVDMNFQVASTELWATTVPASGVVPAGGSVTFDVVFDAGMVSQSGNHTAVLNFTGDFVNTPAAMPLTMHIYETVYLPIILK